MLTDYFWNMALAESLYPSLHAVELALRNAVHSTLSDRYQSEYWYRDQRRFLPNQNTHIADIESKYLRDNNAPITPGRMVAALGFGFWTTILSYPYESRFWRYRRFVLLGQAFPGANGLPREGIHRRFNNIRFLRNRVMHHEAVYDRRDLTREHDDILDAIEWVSPELRRSIRVVDSFPDIHEYGRARVKVKVTTLLAGSDPAS